MGYVTRNEIWFHLFSFICQEAEQIVPDIKRRKQMIYRANHRGIKEMDIILGRYADAHVMTMSADELDAFEHIMDEGDRDLLTWFTGEIAAPDTFDKALFEKILAHTTAAARN